jgi:hypothetical protein
MQTIDDYLSELSSQVKHDSHFKVLASEVMDRLLDIRNSITGVVIDGDEMTKYFGRKQKA